MTLNILGERYQIINDRDYLFANNLDGDVDHYCKVIRVKSASDYDENVDRGYAYRAVVLRHEIIHAFFERAGMERYQKDEDLVQWLAMKLPEIIEVLREAECAE